MTYGNYSLLFYGCILLYRRIFISDIWKLFHSSSMGVYYYIGGYLLVTYGNYSTPLLWVYYIGYLLVTYGNYSTSLLWVYTII